MRSLCRISLAAMIFAVAAGAHAQDPSADATGQQPPANAQPAPVVTPLEQTAPAPVAAEPGTAEQPQSAPAVEPAPAIQEPAAAAPPESPARTTEKKSVEKKSVTKSSRVAQPKPKAAVPAEKTETSDPAAAAAAGTAASSSTTGTGNPPPPADGSVAPAEANPAPPPPPLEASNNTVAKENVETKTSEGVSGWIVLGIVVLAAIGIYLLMSRRRREASLSIYNRDLQLDRTVTGTVKTSPRTGPPITHQP